MSNIRFAKEAQKLAKETGLDRLGQSTLQKLDTDGDGIVRLKDAQKLVKAAGLTKDGSLGTEDRKRIKKALGGTANGGSSVSSSSNAPSSAIAAKAGGSSKTRKLEDGYMQLIAKKVGSGIQAKLDLTSYGKNGAVTGQSSGKVTISGFDPVSIQAHHYDVKGHPTYATSTMPHDGPISETSTSAAGAILLVADGKRGLVLVDLLSSELVAGKQPTTRDLLSPDKLAKDSTVKAAAKALGLQATTLSVQVLWADVSTGFEDKTLSTLALELRLKDASGKSKKQIFSTYLTGNMKKGLSELSIEKLERGLDRSWGWFYPPSAGVAAEKKANEGKKKDEDVHSHHDTGGSENPIIPAPNFGGSENSAPTFDWNGGSE